LRVTETIVVPQLGVNDTTAIVKAILKPDGGRVARGEPIAELESTKVAFTVDAQHEGYVCWLVREGSTVTVQAPLAIVSSEKEEAEREAAAFFERSARESGPPMTKRARALATAHGLTAEKLSTINAAIIRESDVLGLLARSRRAESPSLEDRVTVGKIAIFNASAGGQVVAKTAEASGLEIVLFIDDVIGRKSADVGGIPVLTLERFLKERRADVDAVFVHLQKESKQAVVESLKAAGVAAPTIVHPSAYVDATALLSEGVLVKAGAIVDAYVEVNSHSIVDNGVVLPHHVTIGRYTHVSPGVSAGGSVQIGSRVVVGVGAVIAPEISVGDDAVILPGARVRKDVEAGTIVDDSDRVVGRTTSGSRAAPLA
jgi:sugar O-acyltransferase (sialic acid O-acetyltransferase NeuD family)